MLIVALSLHINIFTLFVLAEPQEVPVANGKHTTLCMICNFTCHDVCAYGDDNHKHKCCAMNSFGNCRVCPKKCSWRNHKNARFIIKYSEVTEYHKNEDLIKLWNRTTTSLEGATLDAMKEYLGLQEQLQDQINLLIELTEELENIALKHNPEVLLHYLDYLVKDARARGLRSEDLEVLKKAKESMRLSVHAKTKKMKDNPTSSVIQVITKVKIELERKNKLDPETRLNEENWHCEFYNDLLQHLPKEIRELAPPKLELSNTKKLGNIAKSATGFGSTTKITFTENLKAIILLIQVLLKKGIFEGQDVNF